MENKNQQTFGAASTTPRARMSRHRISPKRLTGTSLTFLPHTMIRNQSSTLMAPTDVRACSPSCAGGSRVFARPSGMAVATPGEESTSKRLYGIEGSADIRGVLIFLSGKSWARVSDFLTRQTDPIEQEETEGIEPGGVKSLRQSIAFTRDHLHRYPSGTACLYSNIKR